METQRLISVSLGKIAQSRGQRGGINLHRNLLVATVLHKARTAYMIESYNYQQNLQRQRLLEHQQQQQKLLVSGQKTESATVTDLNKGELCRPTRDSNLGHSTTHHSVGGQETRSENAPSVLEAPSSETTPVQDMAVDVTYDKENYPPSVENSAAVPVNMTASVTRSYLPENDHLSAATQLSHEAQLASSEQSSGKQQGLTCGTTTCHILKRRRDNPNTSSQDCPVSKKARVNSDSSLSPQSLADYSSDSSDESDSDTQSVQSSEFHQISNLVNIFSTGFSGLCADSGSEQPDNPSSQSHYRKITTKAG